MRLHIGLVVAGSGCGGVIVAEPVAWCGRVVLKTLAQSRGLLVSVAVGRWQVAWSWELVAWSLELLAWSLELLA